MTDWTVGIAPQIQQNVTHIPSVDVCVNVYHKEFMTLAVL